MRKLGRAAQKRGFACYVNLFNVRFYLTYTFRVGIIWLLKATTETDALIKSDFRESNPKTAERRLIRKSAVFTREPNA